MEKFFPFSFESSPYKTTILTLGVDKRIPKVLANEKSEVGNIIYTSWPTHIEVEFWSLDVSRCLKPKENGQRSVKHSINPLSYR